MMFTKVPCIYFPSLVIMVDDNLSFLENMLLGIDTPEHIMLFDNPLNALDYIFTSNNIDSCSILDDVDHSEMDETNIISIDYRKLSTFWHNKELISVLVVDFNMPEISGDAFFKKLVKNQQKKMMLTGEAESRIAIDLFNNGLIDKFMEKNINSVNHLNQYIDELKKQYFIDLEINHFVSSLNDIKENSAYVAAFNQWISCNNIIKFHQIDDFGSMTGLNQFGTNYYLYVLGEPLLDGYIWIAEENGGTDLLLHQLKNKEMIPVFVDENNKNVPVDEWQKIIRPVNGRFEHNNIPYHYCYV